MIFLYAVFRRVPSPRRGVTDRGYNGAEQVISQSSYSPPTHSGAIAAGLPTFPSNLKRISLIGVLLVVY